MIKDDAKQKMQKALDHYKEELKNLRTGRPSSAMLDSVVVEVYGGAIKLKELATTSVIDSNQLIISPFDAANVQALAKGIEKANLGLRPSIEGAIIRVPIPPMSEERRYEIVKEAKEKGEKAKIMIREHRRKSNDCLKKQKLDGEIAEDEQKKQEKCIQKLTDTFCKDVDDCFHSKEKEIVQV